MFSPSSAAPVEATTDSASPLIDAIAAHAMRRGDHVAIADGNVRLTYAGLMRWSNALAHRIDAMPDTGAAIGVLLPGSAHFIVAVVALLMSGRTLVPMDLSFPDRRNRRIAEHSQMAALVVDAESAGIARRILPNLALVSFPSSDEVPELQAQPRAPEEPPREQRHPWAQWPRRARSPLFAIVYTSGSTGEPKGVCKPIDNLSFRTQRTAQSWSLSADDRVPIFQALSVSTSISLALAALCTGACILLIDMRRLGLSGTLGVLAAHRPTVFPLIPSVFRVLFAPDDAEVRAVASGIRLLQLSGEPLRHADVDLYRQRFPGTCRLWIVIGTAETGRYASWRIDHTTALADRPLIPVGYPPSDIELELVGDDGAPVESGQVGEIVISGRSLTSGYWRDDALTQTRLIPSGPQYPRVRYRTGDLGRRLPDGLLEFVGRRDRQVKVLGHTIHLTEVEAVIAGCSGICEVSVVARPAAVGTRLIAYVVGEATATEIRMWCREHLAAPMRPAEVVIRDHLPRLPNGKLDLLLLSRLDQERARQEGVAPAVDASPPAPPPPPPAPMAEVVRSCWTHCLGADTWQTDARFEDAGGDSLQALELLLALERRLGRKLAVDLVGPDRRPSDLVARLNAIEGGISAAEPDGVTPTVVLIPDYFGANFGFAEFAGQLATRFDVQVIDHRDASPDRVGPIDREQYFALVERKVMAIGPARRLWFIGYGFGCRIAAEAVRRLLARGIDVEFVGMLDGSTPAVSADRRIRVRAQPRKPLVDRIASDGGLIKFIAARVALRATLRILERDAFGPLRWWIAVLSHAGGRRLAAESIQLAFKKTRDAAFQDLPQGPVPMPISVFASRYDYPLANRVADRGWSRYSSTVSVIPVMDHRNAMITGAGAERIFAALIDIEARLRSPAREIGTANA